MSGVTDSMMSKKPRGGKDARTGTKRLENAIAAKESENERRNVRSILKRGISVTCSQRLLRRPEAEDLHDSFATSLAHDHAFVFLECDPPNSLARLGQFPDRRTSFYFEKLDMSVVSASDQEPVIELEAGNTVVMGAEPETSLGALEREDNDPTVRASRDEGITAKLQLANERSMTLKQCRADASFRRPNSNSGIQTTGCDANAIKCNGVDLVIVTFEHAQALPRVHVPQPCRAVITSAYRNIARNVQASDAVRVAGQKVEASSLLDVPNAQCRVA